MSVTTTPLRTESPWRAALPAVALLLLAIGLVFRDTVRVMTDVWWRSDTFAHCVLVLPISLWLVWRRRAELAKLTPAPQPWILLLMAVVAVAWLLAELVVVNAATQFAFVTLLILAVPAVLGLEVARTILFPLLFLYFAVPFGEFMLPTMMEWTADFTVAALRFSGVPVFREGQNFSIPSGNWSVIDECSGVRYVMASFLVGSLFAYLNYSSYTKRIVFMLMALALPVVANWFRAYMIVMLAHLSGNRIAVGVDHILYGWVFFGIIIFLMFIVGSRWSDPDEAPSAPGGHLPAMALPSLKPMWLTALSVLAVSVAPHLAVAAMERAERAAAPVSMALPDRLSANWSTEGARLVDYRSQVLNPSVEVLKAYAGPGGSVGVHLAYFRNQTTERKLVSSQHHLTGMRDDHWALPTFTAQTFKVGDHEYRLRSANLLGRGQGDRRSHVVVWRVYWIDGQYVTSDVRAKLAGMVARLRGHGDEGALLTLHAEQTSRGDADAVLQRFMQDNAKALDRLLDQVHAAR